MRSFFAVAVLVVVAGVGCSNEKLTDTCPSPTYSGAAPTCVFTAQCAGSNTGVELDCSANDGNCVCSENGVVGQTIPYKSNYCNSSDVESSFESINDDCGWKL